ncbi:unnamed protein product [Amoebophrya sp. A25]|nr:unnamed protein product [Amoebophrya sp. A25]|eukprot:GSA25T00026599001.1
MLDGDDATSSSDSQASAPPDESVSGQMPIDSIHLVEHQQCQKHIKPTNSPNIFRTHQQEHLVREPYAGYDDNQDEILQVENPSEKRVASPRPWEGRRSRWPI